VCRTAVERGSARHERWFPERKDAASRWRAEMSPEQIGSSSRVSTSPYVGGLSEADPVDKALALSLESEETPPRTRRVQLVARLSCADDFDYLREPGVAHGVDSTAVSRVEFERFAAFG
jgi:hypothetical protein